MKILVLGVYYSNNLGDGVICECAADRLKSHFPGSYITICDVLDRNSFQSRPGETMETLEYRKKRAKMRHFVTRYAFWDKELTSQEMWLAQHKEHIHQVCSGEYDFVVFAGGQLFMDSYALILEEYVKCFEKTNTPVFFNACGLGPVYSRHIRKRFSLSLNKPNVKWLSSRDDIEKINHLYMPGEKKVIETYDPALWTPEVYGIEKDFNSDVIGLGIMYTNSVLTEDVVAFWIEMILFCQKQKMNWKLFVNGDPNDVSFAKHVFDRIPELKDHFEEYLAPVPERPEELIKLIAGFKSIISFRLHSHIIAASLGIPSVALVWDDKLHFFFEKIGCKERCSTVKDRPDKVLSKLKKAEKEGYDREKIICQKKHADELLYNAIVEEIKGLKNEQNQ